MLLQLLVTQKLFIILKVEALLLSRLALEAPWAVDSGDLLELGGYGGRRRVPEEADMRQRMGLPELS